MERVQGFYNTNIQPTINVVKQKLTGVASAAQSNALPVLRTSYAVSNAMSHFYDDELMRLFMLETPRSVGRVCPHR